MLRRFIIALATIAALAMPLPGGAFAAGRGGHGGPGHGGHGGGGHGLHFGGGGRHFAGPGRFVGGRGFHHGYAPGYYYGGGYGYYPPDYDYYPPDYGYYYEPDYGAAMAFGIIGMISGIMASHLYHHHCWLHHGRRLCR